MSAVRIVAVAVLLALGGCGDDPPRSARPGPGEVETVLDTDADGLCDVTEEELGTDPTLVDSDADGFPDVIELFYGTLFDTEGPLASDLVFLSATRGAQVDQEIRVTVDGGGEGHSGAFDALESPYVDASAADFYTGALAVSAEPPDHVRDLQADAERFGTVLGSTRLSFALSFVHNDDVVAHPDCRRAYPFAYRVKAEGGLQRAEAFMLLVVSPPGLEGDAEYCLPAECL